MQSGAHQQRALRLFVELHPYWALQEVARPKDMLQLTQSGGLKVVLSLQALCDAAFLSIIQPIGLSIAFLHSQMPCKSVRCLADGFRRGLDGMAPSSATSLLQ